MTLQKKTVIKYFGYSGKDSTGYLTPLPGTSQKTSIPASTAHMWEQKGYIEDKGFFVLTKKGYNECE